jgi:hypothetical protein
VRRSLIVILGCALAAVFTVAAPALSLEPYVPKPRDFELAPGASFSRATGGDVVSRPLRAPHRFNLVGMRWSGGGEPDVELRVRREGGRWSRWAEVGTRADEGPDPGTDEAEAVGLSAPVWAGQADWVQYRSSRRLTSVRLHFVNSTGTATAADRARTAVRKAANGGVAAVAALVGVPSARAQGEQPEMVMRSGWGGNRHCPPRSAPDYGSTKAAFVHHTVSVNDYSPEQAPGMVLAICRYHRNSNGWSDIGYSFLVDKYGTLYEGRAGGIDRSVVGAHTQGFNAQAFAVSNIGNHEGLAQTDDALRAMARLIRWKLPLHGQPTGGNVTLVSAGGSSNRWPAGTPVRLNRISGHRDGNRTACPGAALYAQLPELRQRVGNVGGSPTPPPDLTIERSRARVNVGRVAHITGTVSPAKPRVFVLVARRYRGRYRRVTSLSATATTGRFRRGYRFRRTGLYRFRVLFDGDSQHSPATAGPVFVRAVARGGAVAAGRR